MPVRNLHVDAPARGDRLSLIVCTPGGLDILVNNGGVSTDSMHTGENTAEVFHDALTLHVTSAHHLSWASSSQSGRCGKLPGSETGPFPCYTFDAVGRLITVHLSRFTVQRSR